MNRVYKVIWSKAKNCYIVVSELAKDYTKASKSSVLKPVAVAGVMAAVLNFGISNPVFAEPERPHEISWSDFTSKYYWVYIR